MDPFSVAKLGDVTIQRVTSKTDDSKAKSNKDCENETIPNNIASQILQLSKLSPSINITVKSNSSNSLITPATKLDAIIKPPTEPKVQTDSDFTVVSLGPGVELRRKENPKNKPDKNLTSNNVENIIIQNAGEKEPNEHASSPNNDEINCDNKNEKAVLGKPVSCVKNELHNDELSDIGTDCDKKMDFNDSFDTESKTDNEAEPNENTDKKDDKLEQVESSSVGNLEDDFREDGFAASEAAEEPPAPLEEPPGDLPEDIVCKDERFSDKEPDTSESEEADDEFDKEDNGTEANIPKKKKKRKPKSEPESGDENEMKKQKTSPKDEITDSESNEKQSTELKKGLLRKNIREVMDETKLEEATLAAQRQEMERRRRVQEQQRIIRDVQRQIAQNRQNSKMQARVLSLLQKGVTSIIKKEDEEEEEEMLEESKPNTVVVKLSTGSGPPQIVNKKVLDLLKQNSAAEDEEDEEAKDKLVNLSINLDKPQMMTPSVSIAPIKQESKPIEVVNEQEEEKPKDVVMISSSSGEEDDCIVISEEEEESEPDEDPTNSGMHTNDLYNVPDEQGRVLINVGHPESEKDVFLAPQIARIIKPHQIGGVRFLFDNIVESLSRFDTSEGFGCILAHSMGLGKTLQVVSFCDVFLRYTEGKTVLCIMPINTLQNWVAEFNMWLPTDPENSPLKEQGEVSTRQFPIFVLNDNQKTLSARANVIQNWNKEGGVLLIGYELYRQLSLKKPPKSRNRSRRKTEAEEDLEDEKCKNLLETIYSALVKPGPDLVICDEGHRIKNSHASISQALKQIRSKRRVVLTGYPLQNNLMEYWCMVDFVRPNYLGTKTEFSNMFERPIQNGQCIDSTPQDIKLMRYRAHVLHSLLEGFVQRRSHSVLQQTLPTKYEYVLLLRLTPLQKALYNTFMNEVVRTKAVPNPLKAFAVCCKIWNHPDILYNFLKKRAGDEELDLDIEDTTAGIGTPASGPSTPMTPSTPPHQAKRSRASRGSKASKEAKLPRKNSRNNSSSTNAKTPLIAAVPPNTANTSKPASPEQPTNPSTPMAFDSFGSQFQNFNQTNENFGEFNSSSGNANNFNNQFNPEFRSQSVSNNQEFNNANYQQNFGEANFYNSGYPQNNYWQGNNDAGGNFYNANASTQPSEEYFQNNTSSNTQYRASEYGGSATPESGGNFNNSNFNFDLNSQLNYANEFAVKQDPNAMFGMDGNPIVGADLMMDSGANEMSGQGFTADVPSNEANFRENDMTRFANQNLLANAEHAQNDPMISGINEGVKNRRQNAPPFQSPAQIRGQMNSGVNYNQNIDPGKGGIRMAANRARSNPMLGVRSGPVGRPRNNANFRANKDVAGVEKEFKFKPGLPGGAPVLKHGMNDGQNFQNMAPTMDTNQTHLLAGQLMADELSMFSQGQMNANFLDSLRSEELWNPNTADQNTLFNEQNYIYDDANQMLNPTNANFIANEAPALLPRASRGGLINEIPSNDNLFGGVAGNYAQNNATEHDLFAIENFNYLNELQNPNYQMSSHTSFMGLLEGDDSLGITRNASAAGDNLMKTTQFAAQSAVGTPMNEGNFMDPALQFQNASLLDQNNAMAVPNSDLMPKNAMDFESNQNASAPLEKDVNQSLMGLTRRGQITLKVIDKKNEAQPKLNEQSVMEQSGLDGGAIVDALASPQNQPAFGQNRLPSINVFNTSQNFVSTARMNQESSNFAPMAQFSPYGDAQSAPSTQCATTWDNFDASASAAKYPMQRQSSVSEESQFAFNQNQIMQAKESPQYDHRTVTGKSEPVEEPKHQMFNADNRTMFKKDTFGESYQQNVPNMQPTAKKDELHNQYLNSAQNEQKKINEENSNKNIFQTPASTSKPDTPRNAGKFPAKLNPPGASKVPEKKPAARRNVPMSPRAELAKPYQKSEPFSEPSCSTSAPMKPNPPTTVKVEPKDKPSEGETDAKMPAPELPAPKSAKEEPGIPYDWTNEYFKDYEPGKIEASAKTLIFFCMLEEIIRLGDRLLLFSQSLFTLDLIEDFLQMFNIPGTEEKWARNKSYFRLDGSTTALEREKLINEFNSNPNVHLFLVSTRAGSLGINLVGANRVVVFDASWNPCHDTQAVCRVYRYGQQKCCYVYRFVMDNCLEKKIYDRQINKQGMSDRIVDECNPDAHLTIKDVSNLCWDNEDVSDNKKDFTELKDKYNDCVIQTIIERFSSSLSKEPFQHESLLVDRKDNKLSQAEKRMAKRSYELEKQASLKPSYGFYNNPHAMQNRMGKPMASVRPMQADNNQVQRENLRRWIPADVWQKQGMSAQEMTLPLDVVIPTNTSDSRSSIVLKAGQKVMVLKSPKGIYMQLENGKIIAIKTAMKPALGGQNKLASLSRTLGLNQGGMKMLPRPSMERPLPSLGNRRDVTVSPIRNRFVGNMRTNTNLPIPGMRPGLSRGPRPGQPIVRTFPLARSQSPQMGAMGSRLRVPVPASKQIFGPNSSVTISLANKKKMESQEHGNLTEVNYEDYNPASRSKEAQNTSHGKRLGEEGSKSEHAEKRPMQFSDFPSMDEGTTSKAMDSLTSFATSQMEQSRATGHGGESSKMNVNQANTRFADVAKSSPKFSDVIPESLRFKKDINLTPVKAASQMKNDSGERSVSSVGKQISDIRAKTNQNMAQQHYQMQQQKLNQTAKARRDNLPAKSESNLARGGKTVKPETSGLSIPEAILGKKDVQVVRNSEPVTKSNSQHSISIFPVGKKQEDAARGVETSQPSPGFETSKGNPPYFSDYQKSYRDYYQDGNKPTDSSQYSGGSYDAYKSNYQSNFPQHQSQEYASSQHPYASSQYPSASYASHDYGSGTYSGDNSSHYVNSMFSNQSHTSNSNSFNSYDQYSWQNFPQTSKTDSSQHLAAQSSNAPSQPPSQ